jgi:hypothetical protein
MTATLTTVLHDSGQDRVRVAAKHLYDAECAVHSAHQSHVDAWVKAASDKLHDAIEQHLAAIAQTKLG